MPNLNAKIDELIKTQKWDQLKDLLTTAGENDLSNQKRTLGWLILGNHYSQQNNLSEAIIAYNHARVSTLNDPIPFDHLIGAIWRMYQSFHGELSRDAVILLKDLLERLINYYKIHNPIFSPSVFAGQHLIMALREHVGIAPVSGSEKVERKINEIYNALYSDMTIEEVRAEFARIMAPHFRDRMEQMEKDESGDDEKPKKKRGSKK